MVPDRAGADTRVDATIPDAIRKAVIARDKGCAWPGGCDRRPAACDVHHVKHKRHGGKTILRSHGPPPTAQPSG
jgi:5-methylcytosine-specific restriction endonuclease McrA